jgi:hypothetical protein
MPNLVSLAAQPALQASKRTKRAAGQVVFVLSFLKGVAAKHRLTINYSVHIYSNIPTPPSSPALQYPSSDTRGIALGDGCTVCT